MNLEYKSSLRCGLFTAILNAKSVFETLGAGNFCAKRGSSPPRQIGGINVIF